MRAVTKTEFKRWQRLPALPCGEREATPSARQPERGECQSVLRRNKDRAGQSEPVTRR